MFQFTWFNKTKYSPTSPVDAIPDDFVKPSDISSLKTLYWEEHCLECSPPHCYGNCNHYLRRKDASCIRFPYGIKDCGEYGTLWNAQLKFRTWAKLESRINLGSVSIEELQNLKKWDKKTTSKGKNLSKLTSLFFKDYKFSQRAEGIKRRTYATIKPSINSENTFLFQFYSFNEEIYNFALEITDNKNQVLVRETIKAKPGFNQYVKEITCPIMDNGLIRIYPESDFPAEIRIFACDLVSFKGAKKRVPAKKVKCVAWDLDNTIWDGILIESDPKKLQLRSGVLYAIKELDKRGIIQIICSKNTEAEVLPVLKRLQIDEYFVYKLYKLEC